MKFNKMSVILEGFKFSFGHNLIFNIGAFQNLKINHKPRHLFHQ